jgi:putative SOS response-associated peptidase YedK
LIIRQTENVAAWEFAQVQWGLVPSWASDPQIGNRLVNARSETAAEKPAFRQSLQTRRCLIVADGFYEWQSHPHHKQPYYISNRTAEPFGIGGLWDRWENNGKVIESCTILTCEAHEAMQPIHHRMPVVIPANHYPRWLRPNPIPCRELTTLLRPFSQEETVHYPVSTLVNNVTNDSPECMLPSNPPPHYSQATLPFD